MDVSKVTGAVILTEAPRPFFDVIFLPRTCPCLRDKPDNLWSWVALSVPRQVHKILDAA